MLMVLKGEFGADRSSCVGKMIAGEVFECTSRPSELTWTVWLAVF